MLLLYLEQRQVAHLGALTSRGIAAIDLNKCLGSYSCAKCSLLKIPGILAIQFYFLSKKYFGNCFNCYIYTVYLLRMVYIIEILQHFSYSHEYGQYCNKGMLLLAIH